MTDSLVPVEVGACRCPGTPHPDGDIVYLYPKISLHGGAVAQRKMIAAVRDKADQDEIIASLMDTYVRYGVAEWTLVDDKGAPLPVTPENLASTLLADFALGIMVADKADDLYSKGLLDPLRAPASTSSAPTPTNGSTSVLTSSRAKRPKPSKRSSTSTTPTDDTAPTSP